VNSMALKALATPVLHLCRLHQARRCRFVRTSSSSSSTRRAAMGA
jgi:hypothetical protein